MEIFISRSLDTISIVQVYAFIPDEESTNYKVHFSYLFCDKFIDLVGEKDCLIESLFKRYYMDINEYLEYTNGYYKSNK